MLRSMMQVYVKGSAEAVKLYQKAFDAKLISEYKNDDGSYMHAELDVLYLDKYWHCQNQEKKIP